MKKLLLSAYSCWPSESSEPGVGWRFARILSKDYKVWLLVQNAPGIIYRLNEHLQKEPNCNLTIVPHPDSCFWSRFTDRWINLYYPFWQRSIFRRAFRLHQLVGFDLVHHVTLSRYWMGSGLIDLPVPFIWGPVGAGETPPPSFMRELPLSARRASAARNGIRCIFECDPLLRRTARQAAHTLAITPDTVAKVKSLGARRVDLMPQIHFNSARFKELAAYPRPASMTPLRLVSVGRLVYWKGFHLGIRLVAELLKRGVSVEYEIINDGPFRPFLEKISCELQVTNNVKFLGHLPRYSDVLERIASAHALVHTALHEAFGNVCLEALSIGRPVICLDIGGPPTQITPECGLAAPATDPKNAVCDIADFVQGFSTHSSKWHQLCEKAQSRARAHFHEDSLKKQITEIYTACDVFAPIRRFNSSGNEA